MLTIRKPWDSLTLVHINLAAFESDDILEICLHFPNIKLEDCSYTDLDFMDVLLSSISLVNLSMGVDEQCKYIGHMVPPTDSTVDNPVDYLGSFLHFAISPSISSVPVSIVYQETPLTVSPLHVVRLGN